MIPHYRLRGAGIHHPSDDCHRLHLVRPAINKVTHKDDLTIRVPPCPSILSKAQLMQQRLEGLGVTVNVADDVVVHIWPVA